MCSRARNFRGRRDFWILGNLPRFFLFVGEFDGAIIWWIKSFRELFATTMENEPPDNEHATHAITFRAVNSTVTVTSQTDETFTVVIAQ